MTYLLYPWDATSLSIALVLTAVPVTTQLYMLFKVFLTNKRVVFLAILIIMFLLAQLFWCIWAVITTVMYDQF